MVPVHLDFLHCPKDRVVVRSTADYSRLPFTDGTTDHNGDVAQLSEELVGRAFQDETALLQAGMHLHWALPDGLTRGRHRPGAGTGPRGDSAVFPAVPNRWLVRRRAAAPLPERAWVVESDYVHPDGTGEGVGVAVPYPAAPVLGRHRPFRFLGRAVPRGLWPVSGGEYVQTLTAVGFGLSGGDGYSDPTFAALYPNCHSVFGLHDPDVGAVPPAGLRYDVIGWYAAPGQDVLRAVEGAGPDALLDALEEHTGWTLPADAPKPFPTRTLCYASAGYVPAAPPKPPKGMTTVTVGNTATEALSVALATGIDEANRLLLEDQLEAILLAPRTEHRIVDVGAKFREARHEKGFTARRGGTLWSIVPGRVPEKTAPADGLGGVAHSQAQADVPLPPELAGLLDTLNEAQAAHDRTAAELDALRGQLFADWYKYQLCAYPPDLDGEEYPDIDEARTFVQVKGVQRVNAQVAALTPGGGTPHDRLLAALAAAQAALDALNAAPRLRAAGTRYELTPLEAPRFWQPTDPVVHLACDDATATRRHGRDGRLREDGLLTCRSVPDALVDGVLAARPGVLDTLLKNLLADEAGQDGSVAFNDGDGSPWHPFQLEWQVELSPLRAGGNLHPEVDSYDPGFVTGNFTVDMQGPDLVPTGVSPALAGAAAVYGGTSLLTDHAVDRMRRRLAEHLGAVVLPEFYAATGTTATTDPGTLPDRLKTWYEQSHQPAATDPVYTAVRAYAALDGMDCVAQSLGGFNDALLMHRAVKQLPIGDPLGFAEDREFADAVRVATGNANRSAPAPLNDFAPIRCGALRLLRLRLVDTFGQTRDVSCDRVVPAESLTVPGNPDLVALPPRITQPARVVFRWRAADADVDTNQHPDTTPVCGWLLPDHVDTSLMVYTNQGRALGLIDQRGTWQPAPGGTGAASTAGIGNPHLRALVDDVIGLGAQFLDQFMDVLDTALERIEPESTAEHVDLAVLIGRPIAVVRAEIDLEVRGRPAVHQGWNQFRRDLQRATRDSDGFPGVRFPIRLGAHQQLDDGMIGYWVQGDPTFRSPLAQGYTHQAIRTCADGPLEVRQALDDAPQVVRMLIDPRGKVHVTSGIQPVKVISVPPPHYADSMAAMEMTFPVEPLLTDRNALNLPLPVEPGYRWAWVNQSPSGWSEVTLAAAIARDVFVAALTEEVLRRLLDPHVGWLQEVDGGIRAVPAGLRAAATLEPPLQAFAGKLETVVAGLRSGVHLTAATLVTLADTVAVPAWAALLAAGWLVALPETTTQAALGPRDARAALTGDLLGTDELLAAVLDLGEELVSGASTTAGGATPQHLRGGWLKLRPETTA